MGFSDARLAQLAGHGHARGRRARAPPRRRASSPSTSASTPARREFESHTPYLYSTYESECEAEPTDRKKVMILGSGPNRIGQGIEFDYCCCHASFAFKEEGYETIMVNCNPETVSTDYDTSDRLYFEPLTFEDVMNIVELEKPEGVVIQFGGQTPLRLALPLLRAGRARSWAPAPTPSTSPRTASASARCSRELGHPAAGERHRDLARGGQGGGRAHRLPGAGAARRTCWAAAPWPSSTTQARLEGYVREAVLASPEHPILVDRFLEDAFEVDVDAVGDGERVVIGGILQHIEEAGIHSGDSAMVLPTYKIAPEHLETIRDYTRRLGLALEVHGPDERAVRDQGRRGLRAGGEPARLAHHAVREQGHRRAAGQGGGARSWPAAALQRAGAHRGPDRAPHLRQGVGVPVPEVPGQRHPARARR